MTEVPVRTCIGCVHGRLTIDRGVDTILCAHATPGTPLAAQSAVAQRHMAADQDANVCGRDAIFWEPKQ